MTWCCPNPLLHSWGVLSQVKTQIWPQGKIPPLINSHWCHITVEFTAVFSTVTSLKGQNASPVILLDWSCKTRRDKHSEAEVENVGTATCCWGTVWPQGNPAFWTLVGSYSHGNDHNSYLEGWWDDLVVNRHRCAQQDVELAKVHSSFPYDVMSLNEFSGQSNYNGTTKI